MRASLLGAIGAAETEQTVDFSGGAAFSISIPITVPSFATVCDMYMISPGDNGVTGAGPYSFPGGRGGTCGFRSNCSLSGHTQLFVIIGRTMQGVGFAEIHFDVEIGTFACYAVTGSSNFISGSTVRVGGAGGLGNASIGGGGGGAANTSNVGFAGQTGINGGAGGNAGSGLLPAGAGGQGGGVPSPPTPSGQPGADYGGGGGGAKPGSNFAAGAGAAGFVRLVFKEKAT